MGLLVAVTAPAAACDPFDRDPQPPPPDPLAPLVTGALELAAGYEAAVAAHPALADRLSPVAAAHRAHAAELARVTGRGTPGPTTAGATASPPAGDVTATLAALRAAEQRERETAARACADAPESRVALVGSVAAARASHLEVLRWTAQEAR